MDDKVFVIMSAYQAVLVAKTERGSALKESARSAPVDKTTYFQLKRSDQKIAESIGSQAAVLFEKFSPKQQVEKYFDLLTTMIGVSTEYPKVDSSYIQAIVGEVIAKIGNTQVREDVEELFKKWESKKADERTK